MNYQQFTPATYNNGRVWYSLSQQTPEAQYALLGVFILSIAEFEGFFIPETDSRYPSIAQRNNNPGNLRPVGASTGFQVFVDPLDGWEALRNQVIRNIDRALTLDQFFLGKEGVYPGYAPLGDNKPEVMENYISFVANRMSIPRNIDLRTYFPSLSDVTGSSIPVQGILLAYKPFNLG